MRYKPPTFFPRLIPASALLIPSFSHAAAGKVDIQFADNHFTPQNLTVPAGRPLLLRVASASKQAIEFESFKLGREQVASPGQSIIVRLPALSPGHYDFYDDFHQTVPQGTIVAK